MKLLFLQYFISHFPPVHQVAVYLYSLLEIPLPIFGLCNYVHEPTKFELMSRVQFHERLYHFTKNPIILHLLHSFHSVLL